MASESLHLRQIRHNNELRDHLATLPYCDWLVIVLFYIAVHCISLVFVRDGIEIPKNETHRTREKRMKEHARLSQIVEDYLALKHASEDSRYIRELTIPPYDYFTNARIAKLQVSLAKVMALIE